ncbi:nucleotide-diphospho-sugar transferase [Pontibacter sp. SGAir0037]|uniref:nucleotide-diphospho-sugar transferase n=1 Tax=Pontibacter sp. SGAir0037 TaxID=2571030 RepID=UPI0010CCB746|nr:nucleotide-diphospho-sugar transferase [Pontibacter sp. SGAir0037]QCR22177.1 nucleotide-diphospho-sugar transferase [Pontibacter sp. SGAir0037]
MFETPILFLIFNRPGTTKKVFEKIREIKPKILFVAADGAREGNIQEVNNCTLARQIATDVDWECEVKTLFRNKNLGCKVAVSTALNWFFSEVEEGIILEDDCLPSLSFFKYCKVLLEKFRYNPEVITINGCNYGYQYDKASYFYSRHFNAWGWATWRRASEAVLYDLPDWDKLTEDNKNSFLYGRLKLSPVDLDKPWIEYWKKIFDSISDGALNTWDYFWLYYQLKNKKYSVLPAVNLIKNIGFDEMATHTTFATHPAALLDANELPFPLKENKEVRVNIDFEANALQPISYMYIRKQNYFYIKKQLLKIPFFRQMICFKKKMFS